MIDNTVPTNQFHPYLPETSTPAVDKPASGLGGILNRFGIDTKNLGGSTKNVDMKGSVEKARTYARANPGMVLGGLAAAVIGMGLMRGRRT